MGACLVALLGLAGTGCGASTPGAGGAGAQAASAGESAAELGFAAEPCDLYTKDEAARALDSQTMADPRRTGPFDQPGGPYLRCMYAAAGRVIAVSVVKGAVTVEEFNGYSAQMEQQRAGSAEPVSGLGDSATWNEQAGALRAVKGTTVLVVNVQRIDAAKVTATEVMRAALERLP